jgi:hypothetical protein
VGLRSRAAASITVATPMSGTGLDDVSASRREVIFRPTPVELSLNRAISKERAAEVGGVFLFLGSAGSKQNSVDLSNLGELVVSWAKANRRYGNPVGRG